MNNFDLFRTEDGSVSKYIHDDGSETAIKIVKSVQNVLNPLTNTIESRESERNKYSIFISSSVGCYMRCKFCHLTLKNAEYIKISADSVLSNIKEALDDMYKYNPDIAHKYVKLSWMGMGDAINNPEMVEKVTLDLLDWIFERGYALGLDGVDLSTVMPPLKTRKWIPIFHRLEAALQKYKINPVYHMDNVECATGFYSHKNIFRLFYSVESALQNTRDIMVPNAMPILEAVSHFKEYSQGGKYPVILHHLIIEQLNDNDAELDALIDFVNTHFEDSELRVLRYNFCAKSDFKESDLFISQVRKLSDSIKFLKVQVSPGTEVSAACGQFIVKDFVRSKQSGTCQIKN